jgi:hypothetical protein
LPFIFGEGIRAPSFIAISLKTDGGKSNPSTTRPTFNTMSDPAKYQAVQSQVVSDYDHVGEQMKRRDKYLTRNLRRIRIFTRTLDVFLG